MESVAAQVAGSRAGGQQAGSRPKGRPGLLWLKAQRLWYGLFGPELGCGDALSSLCAFSQRSPGQASRTWLAIPWQVASGKWPLASGSACPRRLTWGMGCRGSFSLSMTVLGTPAAASALQMRSAL